MTKGIAIVCMLQGLTDKSIFDFGQPSVLTRIPSNVFLMETLNKIFGTERK